jgi:polyisoprenoid-binding protein YceI
VGEHTAGAPAKAVAMRTLALVILVAASAAAPPPARLEASPADAGLRIHVHKRGLFSAFAHDHDFEVTRWQAFVDRPAADPARAALTLTAAADSLRDREHGLSDGDRAKVEAQAAGPGVLDAAASPEIVYRVEDLAFPGEAEGAPLRGAVHGQLTLRGRTRPVDATYEAQRQGDGWRVKGTARFRQSDFGIKPFSGAGGTVGVKDEVDVTFALALRPAGGKSHAAAAGSVP